MNAALHRDEFWEREQETWPNRNFSSFVDAGGIHWHVQHAGSGPPLLLIHGTGASTHSWRDLMPILAQHYAVIALDLPGHGFTDGVPARRRSIAGMSDCVHAVLREMQIAPVFCVGHSAGAVIACRMALDAHIAPEVIISINGAFLPLSRAAHRLFSPLAQLLAGSSLLPELLARHVISRANVMRLLAGTGSQLDAQGADLYHRLVRNPRHLAGALGMMGSWDLDSFARELPRLATRLVLMVGSNDLAVPPRQAIHIRSRVRDSEVLTLADLGHLAHEEAPERVAHEIIRICRARSGAA